MKKLSNWDARIGRRVRLRDLHVLLTVVQHGSMGRAASSLGVSQPAISDAIATLEVALGVRLLDRTRRGVQPTIYGDTLLKYGRLAIDSLRQGVKEMEFLADPTAGELRIGCPESVASGPLVPIIERLAERYPRVRLHVDQFSTPTMDFPALERREVDLVIARLSSMPLGNRADLVDVEVLFDDRFCIAVGANTALGRRGTVGLKELLAQRWIMAPVDTPGVAALTKVFADQGLPSPEFSILTYSVFLRSKLASSGRYVTALPASVLRLNTDILREMPISLPLPRWPVAIVTLKDRALNPAVRPFVECAREVAPSLAAVRPHEAKVSQPASGRGRSAKRKPVDRIRAGR
jgi:DNA-binding transcriptional LysR family regulator